MKSIRDGLVIGIGITGILAAVTAFAVTPAGGAPAAPHPTAVEILGATAAGRGKPAIPLSPAGRFGKLLVRMTVPADRWWISAKLNARSEAASAPTGVTYAACTLDKLFFSGASSPNRPAAPRQVLKGKVELDANLLEITKFIPAAGGPGQSAGPDSLSAVVHLRFATIVGVLCTDAGNQTEASNVVLSAVGG